MKKNILNQIFILTIIVGLVSSYNIFAQYSLIDFGSANVEGTRKIDAPLTPVVFLNQAPNTVNGLFADASCALCGTGQQTIADNFAATIANATTGITELVIWGGYYPEDIPNTTDNFTIIFHADNAGLPGTVITTRSGLQATSRVQTGVILFGTHEYEFTFDFSSNPIMVPSTGTYWIELFNNSVESGNFYWETGTLDGTHGIVGNNFATQCPGLTWLGTTGYEQSMLLSGDDNVTPCAVGAPSNPNPPNGTTGISNSGTTLTWINGASTTQVEVWFGAGVQTKVYDGPTIASWPTGPLSYFTDYSWRIVCKNAVCGTSGPSWTFQTMQDPSFIFYEPFNTISCWTPIGPLGLTNWSISSSNLAGGSSPPELVLSWTPAFVGLSKLVSCNITTAAVGQLHALELHHFMDWYADPAGFSGIGISYNNGTTYSTIWEFQPVGGNVGPETINVLFTPTAGTFQLVLYHNGDSFNIDFWYVDDIKITLPLANDVGTLSVDVASSIGSGLIAPKATVKNFGTATQTFNVQMTIGAYSSTKTVTGLAAGATQQVTFDNWNATPGSYTVNVCTQLGGDQNTANDCLSKPVTVFSGSWAYGSPSPVSARAYGGSATYIQTTLDVNTGFIFIMGGVDTTLTTQAYCDKYNVTTNIWSSIAPMPAARDRLTAVTVGGFVYAIGGYDAAGVYSPTVYKYDIAGNSWTTAAPLPAATGWGQAVAYGNKIYVVGGVLTGDIVTSAVYVYDVVSNSWTSATSLPGARFGGACSITGNQIVYVAGVDDLFGLSDVVYVGTISGSDPTLIAWTSAANKFPGSQKVGYSVFGRNSTRSMLIKPNKDKKIPEALPYPVGGMYRFDGATWGTDGIIVATGTGAGNMSSCYVYKPGSDTWLQQADVLLPLLGANVGSVNDGNTWKFLLAWGDPDGSLVNNTRTVQIYTDNLGATTFQLSVNTANGWNMVSAPGLNSPDQTIGTWWFYREAGSAVYKFAGSYQSVTTVTPGIGYWMKQAGARVYNTGDEWPAGGIQIVAHAPLTGTSGWNMIGGYEISATASLVTTVPPGLQSGPIYKFSGGYTAATTIDPGYGYWIKLTGAGQIIIPETLAKDSKPVEWFPENWGKIVLTDAAGVSYTLYAVSGDVDLSQYELPPAPMAGMFDIRYSSGRIAEDLTSVQTIELSGVQYPLSVKVENMSITLQDPSGKEGNTIINPGDEVTISNNSIDKLMVISGGLIAPIEYALEQNYPNPFNPSTTIKFSLPEATDVSLNIYNTLGQKVAQIVNSKLEAGRYSYQWDAGNIATGMYIYELRTDKFISVKKMILLK